MTDSGASSVCQTLGALLAELDAGVLDIALGLVALGF